jgi:CHAT domain-containing protein
MPAEETARSLWQERFAPLSAHLDGVEHLVAIPSGIMAGFPLDVLVDDSGMRLADRFSIRLAPSCAVFTWSAERSRQNSGSVTRALLVGDPAFTEKHLIAWSPPVGGPMPTDVSVLRDVVRGHVDAIQRLPRLPWSRLEVKGAARLIPESTLLLGSEASAGTLRAMAESDELEGYDLIHLATHALVNPKRPERSALVLTQVDRPAGSIGDGILTAQEIQDEWTLNADLVVLSACETALGRRVQGEGTVGFAYPLFLAGARSVIASLWPVNDEASALLMERFYQNWLHGSMNKADALQSAKQWLRDWRDGNGRQRYSHPFYWAAFTLVGA